MHKSSRCPATKKDDGTRQWHKQIWRQSSYFMPLALVLVLISAVFSSCYPAYGNQTTSNCTPDAILVNPCRPWFGAAASGNPGASRDQISQANYLEKLVGRPLDIFRFYHNPSGGSGGLPLDKADKTGQAEIHFAERSNTYIQVNWKPASTWAAAGGGNATINAQIKQAADNI